MKKLILVILFSFISTAFSNEFQKGNILIRDGKNIYIFNKEGQEIDKISDSGHMVWDNNLGLVVSKIYDSKVIFRIYKTTNNFSEVKTEIKVKEINKLLKKKENLILLYTDKNNVIKIAIFSKDFKLKDNFPLRDPSGNPEILNKKKAIIHDALVYKEQLWISGYPYHSGGISCFNLKFSETIPDELKGLFSEKEIKGEVARGKGKRIKTLSGIAGNNRGLSLYDNKNIASISTNPPGKITVFSPDTSESFILTSSIDPNTGQRWGFQCIFVLGNKILVSNVHSRVKKIYIIDKKTGKAEGIFKEGISFFSVFIR